jgi:flagellar M-ring protein FliF
VVETVDVPAWRQAGNIEMAKTLGQYLLLALGALFVWFAVLRPLLRKHLQPISAVAPPPGRQEPQPDAAGAPAVASVQAQAAQREGQRHVDNVQYAQDASANDPRMVAALIQNWIKT